jgi:hypothetical protein
MTYHKTNSTITQRPFFLSQRCALQRRAEDYGLVLTDSQKTHPEKLAEAVARHEHLISEISKMPRAALVNTRKMIDEDESWGEYELELLSDASYYNIGVDIYNIEWDELESAVRHCKTVTETADNYGLDWEPYRLDAAELVDRIEEYEQAERAEQRSLVSDYYHSVSVR